MRSLGNEPFAIDRVRRRRFCDRQELEAIQKNEKEAQKELLLFKEKTKKLQEKLSQERGWQEKEQADVDKRSKEIHTLKDDLKKAEENIGTEHSQRLLLEREAKEIRENIAKEKPNCKKEGGGAFSWLPGAHALLLAGQGQQVEFGVLAHELEQSFAHGVRQVVDVLDLVLLEHADDRVRPIHRQGPARE